MTTPATTLEGCLPADNDDHGPIAVPSDAVRGVLGDATAIRSALSHHLDAGADPCQDRGVYWPCDVADALLRAEDGT